MATVNSKVKEHVPLGVFGLIAHIGPVLVTVSKSQLPYALDGSTFRATLMCSRNFAI